MLALLLLLLLLADKVEAMSGSGGGEDGVLAVAQSDVVRWAVAQQLARTQRGRSGGRECRQTHRLWWVAKAGGVCADANAWMSRQVCETGWTIKW